MVAYGYSLPSKNNEIRLKNLKIGLANEKKKILSNQFSSLSTIDTLVKPISSEDKEVQTEFIGLPDLVLRTKNGVTNPVANVADIPVGVTLENIPIDARARGKASIAESLTKSFISENKRAPSEEEKKQIDDTAEEAVNKQSNVLLGLANKKELKIETPVSPSNTMTSSINDLQNSYDQKDEIGKTAYAAQIKKYNQEKAFNIIKNSILKGEKIYGVTGNRQKNLIPENLLSFNKEEGKFENKNGIFQNPSFYNKILELNVLSRPDIDGRGLVRPHYMDNSPNFGNLYISHPGLKKGNLVIMRPYSKNQLISERNISNLLKKMLFDIANTLEFDVKDYGKLDADEKRIIERIIKYQTKMKDYNINKLIDDDNKKIKKRLEILSGEVNAGNTSKLIIEEMIHLVTQLYKNKEIGYLKYASTLKAIKALH